MMMTQPMNAVRRFSIAATLKSVDQMQYSEKMTMMTRTTIPGVPSHVRVLDSRSYLRMTASTSAAVPTSTSISTLVSTTSSAVRM